MITSITQFEALVIDAIQKRHLSEVCYDIDVQKINNTNPIVTIYNDGYTMVDKTLFLDGVNNGVLFLTILCFGGDNKGFPTYNQEKRILDILHKIKKNNITIRNNP